MMRHTTLIRILAAATFAALAASAVQAQAVAPASAARWAPDGKHLQIGSDWINPASGEAVAPKALAGSSPNAMAEEFRSALGKAAGSKIPKAALAAPSRKSTLPRAPESQTGAVQSADQQHFAVVLDGALWAWSADGEARKLRDGMAGARFLEMAPDGATVSFLADQDLWITSLTDGQTRQITDDGSELIFNGELDWVYQEEVYGRFDFDATWWAPSGAHLAYLRTDEEGVDTFTVVDHRPNALELELLKYPKAGTTNPRISLHVARATDGSKLDVDLSKYPAEDEILIVRVGWTPDGSELIYLVQDREQTWMDLNFADPTSGETRTLLRETAEDGWVERLPLPVWLPDGSFLWESDRTGYRHIYRYSVEGELLNAVTAGEWTVRETLRLDAEAGWIVVYGSAPGYRIGQHAWRATLDGESLLQLTEGRGTHQIELNADGSLLLDKFSSLESPEQQWLRRADGSAVRAIVESDGKAQPGFIWQEIEARDGQLIDIAYALPRNFDESKSYPVWIEQYSGPAAPTLRDRWIPAAARPADFILVLVNVRSANDAGMKFTKQCYHQFGVQELKDIEDAVDWLVAKPWADAARVGISGWSYGGFMAAYALTHSKKFKCGVAGAGVYDWALYDTIYTERYMGLPQTNPDGYRGTSVLAAAKDLHGQLLIVHGTMDDNVHLQNALKLVDALLGAGQDSFELMLYPGLRHDALRHPHFRQLVSRFRGEHL